MTTDDNLFETVRYAIENSEGAMYLRDDEVDRLALDVVASLKAQEQAGASTHEGTFND